MNHCTVLSYQKMINDAFDHLTQNDSWKTEPLRDAVDAVLLALDSGTIRVCEKIEEHDGTFSWQTHQWIKKAILLSFRLRSNHMMGSPHQVPGPWYDKIPLKTQQWTSSDFNGCDFRSVPGAIVRQGAYVAPNAILMPSFINIGAFVGRGTLIDTWATVGSCAQVGNNCHISGGVGIGGVLEPLQANPVIIEDNCFIGARSEIAEGVIVEEGSVISMGVFLGASTKIIDRTTKEIFYGRIPAYSVVVPGVMPLHTLDLDQDLTKPQLSCAVIVKRVDEKTRSKTSINDLLRI